MQIILDLLYLKVSYAHWPLVGLLTRHYTSGLRQEKARGYNDNGTKYSDIPKLMACPLDAWKTFCSLRSRGRRTDLKEHWVRSRDTADFLFTRKWENSFFCREWEKQKCYNFTAAWELFHFWKCDLLKSSYPLRCPRPSLINRRLLSQSKSLSFLFFTAAMPNNSQIHQRYITVAHTTPPRCWKMHEAPQTDTHHSTQAILSSFSENWTWPFLESDVE